jgi:hypothetical protein
MGWSVQGVEKLLGVYGHGDVGALEEIDAAFRRNVVPGPGLVDASKMQEGS